MTFQNAVRLETDGTYKRAAWIYLLILQGTELFPVSRKYLLHGSDPGHGQFPCSVCSRSQGDLLVSRFFSFVFQCYTVSHCVS